MLSLIGINGEMLAAPVQTSAMENHSLVTPSTASSHAANSPAPDKADDAHDFAQWEDEIRAFETRDRQQMPPRDGCLFVGSSSIAMWTTMDKDFPGVTTINRGFGGSQLIDSVYFAPRIMWPYAPRLVLLYAGDNDLAEGKTPVQIGADWRRFVAVVRQKWPQTRIAFISIKPSPQRLALMPEARQANALIRDDILKQPSQDLIYVDVWSSMLDGFGRPRAELFGPDNLHMNQRGYRLWTQIIAPYLK